MTTLLIILAVVAVIFVFFAILQWASNRTYKPTISEVISILEDCKSGQMSRGQYDEFSCVRIAYDSRLDEIREKFNEVTDNPQYYIANDLSENDATALNDAGKREIEKLIAELRHMSPKSA